MTSFYPTFLKFSKTTYILYIDRLKKNVWFSSFKYYLKAVKVFITNFVDFENFKMTLLSFFSVIHWRNLKKV